MITKDNRTPEQRETHRLAIVARDKFLSGKLAGGGVSRCAWALHPEVNADRVFNWVKKRHEMTHVNIVDLDDYRPRNTTDFHIYACNPDHVAAKY